MRLFFSKLHSLVHKLKAIDFALHTSHFENLLWNVLELSENHARHGAQSVLKYLGGIEQSTLKPSALCDSLRPLSHFPLCPKYSLPRPPSVTPIAFFFLSELAIMIDVQLEEKEILILIW